jgi:hypothetical protein
MMWTEGSHATPAHEKHRTETNCDELDVFTQGRTLDDILKRVSIWNQISKGELLEMLKEI